MTPLKPCLLSSEIVPYAKTGGLADMTGALLQELSRAGHDARAFMPLYASIRRARGDLQPMAGLQDVSMTIGGTRYSYSVRTDSLPGSKIPVYFIDCPAMFGRPTLYTSDPDEYRRFLLFTRAAIESCQGIGFAPDVFHCNDWHTAFLPLLLKTMYASQTSLARVPSVLTIHNIGYQGVMPAAALADLGLGEFEDRLDAGDRGAGIINSLKTGIKFADVVTTVSPTYAREICETPLGMGMQQTLRERRNGVIGILNGVDYAEWDPAHDAYLTAHFDPENLSGKHLNKRLLLETAGLRLAPGQPLLGMVARLTEQKGIDLLVQALPPLLRDRDFGLVILGSGEARYVKSLTDLAGRFSERVSFHAGHDERLAHLIEAGSDMFLMPSRYEPCGLNQMYSLRYGTVPIVRRTGGLADTVQHYDRATGRGTGCVFNDYDVPGVTWAIRTALDWFNDSALWSKLMANGMSQDFSWSRQTARYEQVYRDAVTASRAIKA